MTNRMTHFDESEFDDELFEQFNEERKEEEFSSGRKKWNFHKIFFIYI